MPEFKENKGFKMKNMAYWKGKHGESAANSPFNYGQANRDMITAQKTLTDIETAYREPGWAKAATTVVDSFKKPLTSSTSSSEVEETDGGEETNGGEETKEATKEKVVNIGDLFNTDLSSDE